MIIEARIYSEWTISYSPFTFNLYFLRHFLQHFFVGKDKYSLLKHMQPMIYDLSGTSQSTSRRRHHHLGLTVVQSHEPCIKEVNRKDSDVQIKNTKTSRRVQRVCMTKLLILLCQIWDLARLPSTQLPVHAASSSSDELDVSSPPGIPHARMDSLRQHLSFSCRRRGWTPLPIPRNDERVFRALFPQEYALLNVVEKPKANSFSSSPPIIQIPNRLLESAKQVNRQY